MAGLETPSRILLALRRIAQVSEKTYKSCIRQNVSWWNVKLMALKWIQS